MRPEGQTLQLSASDLVGNLNCRRLTELDLAVAKGQLAKPPLFENPLLETLRELGARHEAAYVEHLVSIGLRIVRIPGQFPDPQSIAETLAIMKTGADVIVQAALQLDQFRGRADVLLRVERPSALGPWSYEAVDTKLARETKAGTILQLCLYSEMLAVAQGRSPEHMHVVVPWSEFQPQTYRTDEFAAYFRQVRAGLERDVGDGDHDVYPEPVPHCDVCRWEQVCDAKRRADDHLTLVAGISKSQIKVLTARGIETTAALAAMELPITWKPDRGSVQSLERMREQARLQVEGRNQSRLIYERLPFIPNCGLARLPAPSPGDIFLDFEGDPFAGEGGLEYLTGYAWRNDTGGLAYKADWALSRTDERAAFERFIDFVIARLERYAGLHVYHYAAYEPGALKRLAGRYATRQDELDRLLRAEAFVDLYAVVRHGIRASVESYSIKRLEPFYEFDRSVALKDANRTLARLQACLELGAPDAVTEADRNAVEGYNRDDCFSTAALRDWLEKLRAEAIAAGDPIERPPTPDGAASEALTERQARVEALVQRLAAGIPEEPSERTPEQTAQWTLAHTLDWHRREEKTAWWEYFRLRELDADELFDERAALSGLEFKGRTGGSDRAPVHRYGFPPQEVEFRGGEELHSQGGEKLGKVEAISIEEGWIDIKKRGATADAHADAVFAHSIVASGVLAEALFRIGSHVADHGLQGEGPFQAARDLLLRRRPQLGGAPLQEAGEHASDAAVRIAPSLGRGVLAIQGPPGTGKTHTGAAMICSLADHDATIGITANSHKVIRNLLDKAISTATEKQRPIACIQKLTDAEDDVPSLAFTTDNAAFFQAIAGECAVGGGTAWLWARPEFQERLDVLFVDEAAQMSLANVLAVSQAAKRLVLLGDPQQLDQPTQGCHPEGTDVSALSHILAGEQTISEGAGLFLEETWRLHPNICAFTSEVFYERRLQTRGGLEAQRVISNGRLVGSGLRLLRVPHSGNQSSSVEEAEAIRALVTETLGAKATWIDGDGKTKPLTLDDILIIAPYNAQVFELQKRLPGARIGTVDKFQGQQAAIVIYSMTTSSAADAPRGMEFLYSLNRFNVATSRAKCLCLVVASPAVFDVECRTPRQMQLANAFCRYLEMASDI